MGDGDKNPATVQLSASNKNKGKGIISGEVSRNHDCIKKAQRKAMGQSAKYL